MNLHVSFLDDLGLVLLVAASAAVVFRCVRLPSVLGYLMAGLAVGPHLPIPIFADPGRVESLAEFGVVLVMFGVGLEFTIGRLVRVIPRAGFTAVVQMSTLALCGFAIGRALAFSTTSSLFLGASLAISSTMVVARVVAEQTPPPKLKELVFGVLVVQDIAAVVLLTVLTAVAAGADVSGGALLSVVGTLVGTLVGVVLVGLVVVPKIVRRIDALESAEVMVVSALALCFGMALLARHLGYSVALGAFVAGMLVAESGRGHKTEVLIEPLRDVFAAVFFVSIGMMVDPFVALKNLDIALLLAAVVILGQFVSVCIAGALGGNGLRTSVRAGVLLGQIGEFSFIMITIGTAANVVELHLLSVVVTVAAITAFTTPMLGRFSVRIAEAVEGKLPRPIQTSLTLYERWIEDLHATLTRNNNIPRSRRLGIILLLDGGILVAIVIATSIYHAQLANMLSHRFGMSALIAQTVVICAAVLVTAPFFLTLIRASRAAAQMLAQQVVPGGSPSRPDLGQAPRGLLTVALQVAILMGIGAPAVVVAVPFMPPGLAPVIVVGLSLILALLLWRSVRNFHGHLRAGGEVIVELLSRLGANASDQPELRDVLPGLDGIVAFSVQPNTVASGATLANLNLRARTGATVLAIQRGKGGVATPSGEEQLHVGDRLALSGTTASVESAITLLSQPRQG